MRIDIGPNEKGQRLDKFLRKLLKDVPLGKIFKSIRTGEVKVNGKKCKQNYSLLEGDVLVLNDIETQKADKVFNRVDNGFLKITYEDENFLVVEKWPGVLVHANSKNGDPTLTDYVLSYLYDKGDYSPEKEITFTPASCNRLDRNTSGIVVFGKNHSALKSLNEMIRERTIKKYYVALVRGRITDGLYKAYIVKQENNNLSKVYDKPVENSKEIAMQVNVLQSVGIYTFIEIELITGRSHQLRAHLSHLGNAIVGDPKYGDKKINSYFENKYGLAFQFLYAYKLVFKNCEEDLSYMENKTIVESLPPMFKKIKKDVFKF
ncbi:RluA family pseudouridine synthase [Haloimpatiens sp. FM7315]|uniref:RluA family pseudouridine synthase n=1 Tax=Haloimpatiens sp. FM7315 TaxID=3298609 RepID=UPI0035A38E55